MKKKKRDSVLKIRQPLSNLTSLLQNRLRCLNEFILIFLSLLRLGSVAASVNVLLIFRIY
jgi:hypothetical protein